ncbi:2-C-methyl-D-erythritol 2,4-cyclodiphosphate synthase [Caldinitratiruptor microaerophilus]|uniref:2-C-methyl-D-erythritol 2,4-cyclodiphosphate synthase n=1 Tax=Caldinitratiruptor microaerophilus TaxID=671077 RepID=A0AA35CP36_9FIRM|nr:2-C-methyl-D-erythritol 2,4-cyclodiphosphate synthase [Caldinitratiruptor microaerophilus]BDG62128.1 2-C-methyl-D-erythritol 2,4-cyclodiphosphate synthase [Caldinitratiruptor microaerophilus]
MRIGIGYDIHRLVPGRRLVLGGVEIPWRLGLEGHSDADALTHAVIDAVLGAAGLGDIGQLFPDTDPAFAGADSVALLERVVALVRERGWRVGNVDATVLCERPRIAPHREAMRRRLAAALGVAPEDVGIKATTNEGLGAIGAGEGIACYAVALLVRDSP